jgi:hypothetical protein
MRQNPAVRTNPDRSFRAFLRTANTEPGARLRLVSVAAFALSLFLTKGLVAVLIAGVAGFAIGVAIGYPYFRRRGRLLGGSKTVDRLGQ